MDCLLIGVLLYGNKSYISLYITTKIGNWDLKESCYLIGPMRSKLTYGPCPCQNLTPSGVEVNINTSQLQLSSDRIPQFSFDNILPWIIPATGRQKKENET